MYIKILLRRNVYIFFWVVPRCQWANGEVLAAFFGGKVSGLKGFVYFGQNVVAF